MEGKRARCPVVDDEAPVGQLPEYLRWCGPLWATVRRWFGRVGDSPGLSAWEVACGVQISPSVFLTPQYVFSGTSSSAVE